METNVFIFNRAVFLEFTVYNAYVNLFGIVTLIAEKLPTGAFDNSYRVEAVHLLTFFTSAMLLQVTIKHKYQYLRCSSII